jgi:hypothetical protein
MNETALTRGREAASRGDWQQAHDFLVEADASRSLDPGDLSLLADVAYAAGHLDVTLEIWERAHAPGARRSWRRGSMRMRRVRPMRHGCAPWQAW